jgi:hypothetical protein
MAATGFSQKGISTAPTASAIWARLAPRNQRYYTDTDLYHFMVKFSALITVHSIQSSGDQNFTRQVIPAGIFAERSELSGGE